MPIAVVLCLEEDNMSLVKKYYRYDLPEPVWRGRVLVRSGAAIEEEIPERRAIFIGPESGRLIIEYYSPFVARNGKSGTYYVEIDEGDAAREGKFGIMVGRDRVNVPDEFV